MYAVLTSGGKDSLYALYKSLQYGANIKFLVFTVINFPRPSAHVLNRQLIYEIAKSIGIPIVEAPLRKNDEKTSLKRILQSLNVRGVIAGDILVEEHLKFHADICEELNIELVEPLWRENTEKLLFEIVKNGFYFAIIGIRTDLLGEDWLGSIISPKNVHKFFEYCKGQKVDPCGEYGEYHSIVLMSPLHSYSIEITSYEKLINELYGYVIARQYRKMKK